MNNKSVIVSLLTGAVAAGILTGCGGASSTNVANTDKSISKTEKSEDPYELVVENLTLGEDLPDQAEVEEAINKITLEKINCTIKLKNIHIGDHSTKLSLMAAGNEKMDLVNTGRTYALSSMVADGMLQPLDELLQNQGKELYEKAKDMLPATQFDGVTYAIPAGTLYAYNSYGVIYNKDMADAAGIDFKDKIDMEDLDEAAAKLKEYNPDLYLLSKGDGSVDMAFMLYYPDLRVASGSLNYGMYNATDPDMKLFNPYKSSEYRKYLSECRKWYENNWIPQDSMVSGINARDVFSTGQSFCELSTCSPLQPGITSRQVDFNIGMSYITDPQIDTTDIQENGWGIFVNCEKPDKAMEFLNLMYTDPEVSNLLENGIEGKHYEKVTEHTIQYPENVDSNNVGYKSDFTVYGDTLQNFQRVPTTEESIKECQERDATAEKSPILGYVFDTTDYSTQISNVTNVIAEYMPSLFIGIYPEDEIDAQLKKMNDALDAAGISDLINANQEQLDAFRTAQK